MTTRSKIARIERAEIDLNSGEFPMILATDGEASDGDILSIEGAQLPERVPLQNAHINEARSTLGSVSGFRRDLKSTPKKLRARGQIELEGEGVQLEIRRDIAHMISQGHLTGVSVRWEPIEWVRRSNLPSDHHAFVDDETEKDWRKRYGLFFKKWRVLEGSLAPVQADRESVIGRANETEGDVRDFWRSCAEDIDARTDNGLDEVPEAFSFEDPFDFYRAALPVLVSTMGESEAFAECARLWRERNEHPTEEDPESAEDTARVEDEAAPTPEALEAVAAARLRELAAELQLDPEALLSVAQDAIAPEPTVEEQLARALERIDALEADASARDQGRVNGEPTPPSLRNVQAMMDYLDKRMHETDQKALALVQAVVSVKRGKVVKGQTRQQQIEAEAKAVLKEYQKQQGARRPVASDFSEMLVALDERMDASRKRFQKTLRATAARLEDAQDERDSAASA